MKVLRIVAIAALVLFAVWRVVSSVYLVLVFGLPAYALVSSLIIAVLCLGVAWWLSTLKPQGTPPKHGTNHVLKILVLSVIGAIGLFAGGCSFIFLVPGQTYVPELQIPGFLIAIVCGWAVYGLVQSMKHAPDDPG